MELKIGEIYTAKIAGIKKFGAFVKLPTGEVGMVHISQIQSGFVEKVEDVLQENQEVQVKLIAINEMGKLSFSIKQAQPTKVKSNQSKTVVWQPRTAKPTEDLTFEEMMTRFKSQSEEKISDYRKSRDVKKGGSYKRR